MHNSSISMFYRIGLSNTVTILVWEWSSMESQVFSASHLGWFMFKLVADIRFLDIGSLNLKQLQRHAPWHIMTMTVNGVTTICNFTSKVIYLQIGCRHPFIRYRQPLVETTAVTCSLPHHGNKHQPCVEEFQLPILGDLGTYWLWMSMYVILAALTGETTEPSSFLQPEIERQHSVNSWGCCMFGNQGLVWFLNIHNRIIHCPDRQMYNISNVQYRFEIYWYCKLQPMQNHLIGCWKLNVDVILLTNSSKTSRIWINRWNPWAIWWYPAHCWWFGSVPVKSTQDDGLGWLNNWTANVVTVQLGLEPGPGVIVWNCC